MRGSPASIALLCVAIAGCSTQASELKAERSISANEQTFIDVMNMHEDNVLHRKSDAEMISWGHEQCELLDQGASIHDLVQDGMSKGWYLFDVEYGIGASIYNLCPEYIPLAENYR